MDDLDQDIVDALNEIGKAIQDRNGTELKSERSIK